MSTLSRSKERTRSLHVPLATAWLLVAGGVIFFVGGSMHPKEDPPGVTLKEHLRVMYEDDLWFPAHTVFLVGMVLLAAALLVLVRAGGLRPVARAQTAAVVAAVATSVAAVGSLLHLASGSEADEIASGSATPLTDVLMVAETIYAPGLRSEHRRTRAGRCDDADGRQPDGRSLRSRRRPCLRAGRRDVPAHRRTRPAVPGVERDRGVGRDRRGGRAAPRSRGREPAVNTRAIAQPAATASRWWVAAWLLLGAPAFAAGWASAQAIGEVVGEAAWGGDFLHQLGHAIGSVLLMGLVSLAGWVALHDRVAWASRWALATTLGSVAGLRHGVGGRVAPDVEQGPRFLASCVSRHRIRRFTMSTTSITRTPASRDWKLDDPAGQDIDAVRPIRDEIRRRGEELIAEIRPA